MSTKAFVLVETVVGKTKEVMAALQKIDGIKSVDVVTGPYDIILVVEQEDLNTIAKLVTTKIHPINGITRTVSCISIRLTYLETIKKLGDGDKMEGKEVSEPKQVKILKCNICGKKYIFDSVSRACPKCGGTLVEDTTAI